MKIQYVDYVHRGPRYENAFSLQELRVVPYRCNGYFSYLNLSDFGNKNFPKWNFFGTVYFQGLHRVRVKFLKVLRLKQFDLF